MNRYKLIHKTPAMCGMDHGRARAVVVYTWVLKRGGVGKDWLLYQVRAGRKGTGQELARAKCLFTCSGQEAASAKLRAALGGLESVE
ncbi:MAG: hypothetical protein BWY63_03921 [Chloroflexi bacterium ADurb.Bin360]|nr:MAG: hypothetical protein BWY63_03921 [Chloroflexi bacterium ADurb.Bin360]